MTKRKLHVGTGRDWRKALKKYSPNDVGKAKRSLQICIEKGSLSHLCPFDFSIDCSLCYKIFPESYPHCPCKIFYVKEIKTFVESILKEKW